MIMNEPKRFHIEPLKRVLYRTFRGSKYVALIEPFKGSSKSVGYSGLLLFVTIGEIIKTTTHFVFVHFFLVKLYSFIMQFLTYIECIKYVCKIK